MNDGDITETDIHETLQNGDACSEIGLLNCHTVPQDNKSSKLDDMNMCVKNGDVNGEYCYINISTGSDI